MSIRSSTTYASRDLLSVGWRGHARASGSIEEATTGTVHGTQQSYGSWHRVRTGDADSPENDGLNRPHCHRRGGAKRAVAPRPFERGLTRRHALPEASVRNARDI